MNAVMPDLSRLSHTIKATPEWAQLLICITVFTLCTFLGWSVFARTSSTTEPAGRNPPRYVETEKAAANGTYDEKVDGTQTVVKPVEEEPLDGGEKVDGGNVVANEADEGDGLEEVVVVAMPQGVKGKRTRRRG